MENQQMSVWGGEQLFVESSEVKDEMNKVCVCLIMDFSQAMRRADLQMQLS